MTTETRYRDLLSIIPGGPFYASAGHVLPYRSGPTELRLITDTPNTNYLILINGVHSGIITTDSGGNSTFEIQLPLGDIELEFQREFSTDKLISYVTTRQYGVWYASIAESLEGIDDSIESTLNSFYLAEAGATDINLAHGVPLQYPNDFNAGLEAYRESLQLVRQSYRQFGGRLSGKYGIVAALTQVNPLILDRSNAGPRWILGYQLLPNGDMQDWTQFPDPATVLTNINASGNFITLLSADGDNTVSSIGLPGSLQYAPNFKTLGWRAPVAITYTDFADAPIISSDGTYEIPSARITADITSLHYPAGGYTTWITAGEYDRLHFEIDGLGIITANLSLGGGISLGDKINGYILADDRYNTQREVNANFAGSLAADCWVVSISQNTPITGSGTINHLGSNIFTYTAPSDSAGPATQILNGEIGALVSSNGNNITMRVFNTPSVTSDTFTIKSKYNTPASDSGDLLTIISQANSIAEDPVSSVTIHDGPANIASFPLVGSLRGMFDIPKITTTLTADVNENDTTITVPAGTATAFGSDNFPFEAIVGYGYKSTSITSFRLTNLSTSAQEADLEILAGGVFEKGEDHIVLEFAGGVSNNDVVNGTHKILNIADTPTNKKVRISYGGINASQLTKTNITAGIDIISVDPSLRSNSGGTGTLTFVSATPSVSFTAPVDIAGTPVVISSDGWYRVSSQNGKYVDLLIDVLALPGSNQTDTFTLDKFNAITSGGGDTARIWCGGEKVKVTGVTPSGGNEIWDIESPVSGNFDTGMVVYHNNDFLPLRKFGVDYFGSITVQADVSEAVPSPSAPIADTVNLLGSELPDGWLDNSTPGSASYFQVKGLIGRKSLGVVDSANDVIIERSIPFDVDLRGQSLTLNAWVQNGSSTDDFVMTFRLGFDFGSGYIESSNISVNDPDITVRMPFQLQFTQAVPLTATQVKVRIRRLSSTADNFVIERMSVISNFLGLYTGNNTIPRSSGRSNFGSLIYVWSPDELTTSELDLLGIPAPANAPHPPLFEGSIINIHNAHEEVDAFDVTDVVSSNVVNVRGAVTSADWGLATLTNLDIVNRIPDRFSHLVPITTSQQDETLLNISQIAPHTATLSVISDQDQNNAILFENEIPLPNDQWQFNNSTEIEVTSGFISGAIYRLEYQALTQVETAPIDIVSPSPNGNDTWFADYMVFNRQDISPIESRTIISIIFRTNLEAILPINSDGDKLNSVLTENTGITTRIIPLDFWEYIDTNIVKISSSEFNPNATYSFEYNQQVPKTTRVTSIISEIKSASTVFGLSLETYQQFTQNSFVSGSLRYHQIRLTVTNITDLRDIRIHSATVKGIRVNTPPVVPGL